MIRVEFVGTKLVLVRKVKPESLYPIGLLGKHPQSIIGATLKRRDGSGHVVCGFEANSRGILVYAFMYHFSGFLVRQWCDVAPPFTLVPPEIMVTIRARKKADGTVSYTVQIRLKKKVS